MINLILSNTSRSLIYLEEVIKNNININKIIVYSKKKKDLLKYIKKKKLSDLLIVCKTNNINSASINKQVELNKTKHNIVSTYPGEVIKNSLLLNKKLLHCHPGNLPEFKGSTTIYYSILSKKKICVTLFIMGNSIDTGRIVYKKFFKNPKILLNIEKKFDDKIRALTLIEFLKNNKNYNLKKIKDVYLPYYIAHPIIRQLVINKNYIL